MSAGPAIVFDRVSVARDGVPILQEVSAEVPRGGWTAIVGPNGAGKTTLLRALLGEWPFRGAIRRTGPGGAGKDRIGYVPQRLQFDRALPMTVREFLALGEQRRPLWLGVKRAHRDAARALLASVGAGELETRPLGALSGGEIQRVLLAAALRRDPGLLVLDEPGAGVDEPGETLLCELLERLRGERGFTQLMVSHDLATVTYHATHVILLNRRVVAEGPPDRTLTPENLRAVFGAHMGLANARALPLPPAGRRGAGRGRGAG